MIKAIIKNVVTGEVTEIEGTPEPIVIPIETIQSQKLMELQPLLSQYESEGMPISHNSQTYHLQCRPTDRVNWLGVITMANMLADDSDTVTIMTKENAPITLTKPQVIQAMVDVGLYSQALYSARWAVRSVINNETDKVTLEAYNVQEAFQQALTALIS